MKRIWLIIIAFISISVFIFYKEKEIKITKVSKEENLEMRSVFISYIDYSPLLKNKSKNEQEKNINTIISNLKDDQFNTIILQVRPFCDAIYNSNIYLSSKTVVKNEGDELELDILKYFLDKAHENNMKLYAWINPYRIRSTSSIDDISKDNFYYSYIGTNKIEISDNGIYFNPADELVRKKILDGVAEIVINYGVDGILYDDYFYSSNTIDLENYEQYKKQDNTISIEEYRYNNINTLISETYKIIKTINNKVMFGISPAGNINNNLNDEYLDIKYILSNDKYVDYIMPQIYYGFENESMPFIDTLNTWSELTKEKNIQLHLALALYKSGLEDKYAASGRKEWLDNSDIIKKQIIISRSVTNYKGFAIFRYENLFPKNNTNINLNEEIINLKSIF